MLFEEKDLKEWKEGIQKYYKEKKEKSVEPVRVNKITHKDIKQKEILYHPILQKYQQEEMVIYYKDPLLNHAFLRKTRLLSKMNS